MIALLKAHWIVALVAAVAAWLVIRKRAVATVAVNPNGVPMSVAVKVAAMGAADNGALRNPDDWKPADQAMYPGFYTTNFGGFYNPDTGQSFSPGSSPPSALNAYDTGEAQRPYIDTATELPMEQRQTLIDGANYNPSTANAVIY
jgi:hypothetical protein